MLTHLWAELLSFQDDAVEETNHEHHRPADARLNQRRGRYSTAATAPALLRTETIEVVGTTACHSGALVQSDDSEQLVEP